LIGPVASGITKAMEYPANRGISSNVPPHSEVRPHLPYRPVPEQTLSGRGAPKDETHGESKEVGDETQKEGKTHNATEAGANAPEQGPE